MIENIGHLLVTEQMSIRDAMACIDQGQLGIALLVDAAGRLLSTLTDGDLRRAILAGRTPGDSVLTAAVTRPGAELRRPITAPIGSSREQQLRLMRQYEIRHLPLIDSEARVIALALCDEAEPDEPLSVQAIIMAGGFGKRLRPLTNEVPKPMLPVGGTPLMERTVHSLRQAGVRRINITTHYLPEKITTHFGDGSRFGVELNYVAEEQPLGTAGALGLLDTADDQPLLVMNGDVLARIDFRELVRYHQQQGAELTVGVRQYDFQVPYGVVQARDGRVLGLQEKPKYDFLVNAGIYVVNPSVCRLIPTGRRCDMTDLISALLAEGRSVCCYPILEYWLDIGQPDDLIRAQEDIERMKWAA